MEAGVAIGTVIVSISFSGAIERSLAFASATLVSLRTTPSTGTCTCRGLL